jgi:hypothetical protein
MIHNDTFSRREFGHIAAAGLVSAATGIKPEWGLLNPDAENKTGSLSSPVTVAARELIAAGEIGSVHLGCSSLGDCTIVRDAHEKQLFLLCEILQPGQVDTMQSIAIPATSGNMACFRTLMTTIAFPSGTRIEVTSTADSINAAGCIIRGECGCIHILEGHLLLVSNDNHVQKEVRFDADDLKTQSPHTAKKYAALVHEVMHDARKRISA